MMRGRIVRLQSLCALLRHRSARLQEAVAFLRQLLAFQRFAAASLHRLFVSIKELSHFCSSFSYQSKRRCKSARRRCHSTRICSKTGSSFCKPTRAIARLHERIAPISCNNATMQQEVAIVIFHPASLRQLSASLLHILYI